MDSGVAQLSILFTLDPWLHNLSTSRISAKGRDCRSMVKTGVARRDKDMAPQIPGHRDRMMHVPLCGHPDHASVWEAQQLQFIVAIA